MDSMAQIEKLVKVLALTSSDQDGEALAALRQARQMLFTHGLSLADLAAMLAITPAPKAKRAEIDVTRGLMKAYEARLQSLEQQNRALQKDLVMAERAISRWREMAEATGRDSNKHQAAADKWRALARSTADQLWDLGQQLQALDGPAPEAASSTTETETDGNVISFTKPAR